MTLRRRPSLARVFKPGDIADLFDWHGEHGPQKARRWMLREGIARRTKTGRIYTTLADLQSLDDQGLIAELNARDSREGRER